MQVNYQLKAELIRRFGSQQRCARALRMRASRLSNLVRGWEKPNAKERKKFTRVLGTELVSQLFHD